VTIKTKNADGVHPTISSSSATLGNGETTGLNAKTNAEAAVATAKLQEIASGQGGHYPHKAYKKLEHDSDWIKLGPVARLEVVLALAKQMQQTANASSAVTGWKKVALAGSNPAPAQWTAFLALDADKKSNCWTRSRPSTATGTIWFILLQQRHRNSQSQRSSFRLARRMVTRKPERTARWSSRMAAGISKAVRPHTQSRQWRRVSTTKGRFTTCRRMPLLSRRN
jgi:hypothetical protein